MVLFLAVVIMLARKFGEANPKSRTPRRRRRLPRPFN